MATAIGRVVHKIRERLEPLGSRDRAANEKRYLKSDLEFLGVGVPEVRRSAKRWLRERPELGREDLIALVDELWAAGVHELRTFAIELAILRFDLLLERDFDRIERWLREAGTWAHVDAIAVHLVGRLLACHPKASARLDRWSTDDDFWMRRSSMLALLLELRRGEGDWPRFVRYADSMLEERERFIRKAIGWVLREVSKKRPELVGRFVRERTDRISRLTLREATRHLAPRVRTELESTHAAATRRRGS